MSRQSDLGGALFSAIWPGLGQLAQGRVGIGLLFVTWSVLGVIGIASASSFGISPIPVTLEVVLVGIWSTVDAYRHPTASSNRVAR